MSKPSPHILVMPFPAQGHILPLLDLTHFLSLHNVSITILITPQNLPTLSPLLSAHPNITTLVFPFPPHPLIPPGVENVRYLGNFGNAPVISALSNLFDSIVEWFNGNHHNPPVAIISDFFLGWTTRLARVVNVPRFVFSPSRAFLTCVINYLWRNREVLKGSAVVEFNEFPKTVSFKEEHLPSIFRKYRENDPDWKVVEDGMFGNMESYGVIFNSFESLEGEYLEFLKKDLGNGRVFGVGPLSLLGPDSSDLGNPGENLSIPRWLDGCPDGSVLYVCFGSQKLLNKNQMIALSLALERSMVRFIWVVKPGTPQQTEEGYGVVPDGFDERVEGRGLVIRGWAPQVMLLGHKAVGGFLSHCGWNSVLEGIVGGVMILAWPMEADQFVNARLLVEDKDVAVRACEGAESIPDPTKLAQVIAESMGGGGGGLEKVRARDLRDKAFAAVKEGGSSYSDLNEIVRELHKLQLAKHQQT